VNDLTANGPRAASWYGQITLNAIRPHAGLADVSFAGFNQSTARRRHKSKSVAPRDELRLWGGYSGRHALGVVAAHDDRHSEGDRRFLARRSAAPATRRSTAPIPERHDLHLSRPSSVAANAALGWIPPERLQSRTVDSLVSGDADPPLDRPPVGVHGDEQRTITNHTIVTTYGQDYTHPASTAGLSRAMATTVRRPGMEPFSRTRLPTTSTRFDAVVRRGVYEVGRQASFSFWFSRGALRPRLGHYVRVFSWNGRPRNGRSSRAGAERGRAARRVDPSSRFQPVCLKSSLRLRPALRVPTSPLGVLPHNKSCAYAGAAMSGNTSSWDYHNPYSQLDPAAGSLGPRS